MSRSVFHRGARGGIDNAVLVLHCNIRGDRQCAGEYTAMIETAPLEQAADAYARMIQGKQDSEWCWLQRTESLTVFGLSHDWKVSLEEKEMSMSSKPNSNEKSTETELARSRAAAGPDR